ncbi:MAG: hypothetical protein CL876_06475 [Dehalococcoidales bacterium]|jgi:GTPase SAR1 family protein|nr:hypothetical protein [Dehalococcoidales bacterium]|tara:strand:+ start:137 stop:946 length:810 start_codon:yes stop_codon:yes gene_type:complete
MNNFRWWGERFSEPEERLSIVDLVNFGSLDLRLAGILWLIMERRAPVLVAAGPSNAGKSTLLHVLLDFLPPEVKQVHLEGGNEDFRFTEEAVPANTYMVAAEFSNYGFYIWGDDARTAFELLSEGYGLGGTIHATTIEEAVNILHGQLGLSPSLISQLDLVITIRMSANRSRATESKRCLETVGLIGLENEGLSLQVIATRNRESGELVFPKEEDLYPALSGRFGIAPDQIASEIQLREQFLGNLLQQDIKSHDDVRKAVVEFYRSRPS